MTATTNLSLPLVTLGIMRFRTSFKAAMTAIDTALGDIAGTSVLDAAAGDPVVGDLADKIAAMEARIVALESV